MAGKNTAAFGLYRTVEALQAAVDTLRAEGFRSEDVSVLYPDNVGSKDLATVKTLKRLYALFFIELGRRRILSFGVTANPDQAWVSQQLRNLSWQRQDLGLAIRFLVGFSG